MAAVLLGYLRALSVFFLFHNSLILYKPVKRDIVILPKSTTPFRMEENLKLPQEFAKRVSEEDFQILDSLAVNGKQKRFIMPPWVSK